MKHFLYKIIFTFLILIFNGFASDSSDPSQETEAKKHIAVLLPFILQEENYTKNQLDKIVELICITKEKVIPQADLSTPTDFGYSFPRLSPYVFDFLCSINQRVITDKTPPICYDLGSGYGEISLYMTLAGGQVHAIEQSIMMAAVARKKTYTLLKNIALDENQKKSLWGNFKMYHGNAINLDSKIMYPNDRLIDFAYMGHFLHFLTPTQIPPFLSGLYAKMAPEGQITAVVHAPFSQSVDLFYQQKKAGNDFPGHIVFIQDTFPRIARDHEQPGHYYTSEGKKGTIGLAAHFFDTDTLKKAFENSGFTILNVTYLKNTYQDIDHIPTYDQLKQTDHILWIKAQKN